MRTSIKLRKPGRPRSFDADLVFSKARDRFWERGFAGTSLDELSAATGLQRPSLYGAFGDKATLFETIAERYGVASTTAIERTLAEHDSLRAALQAVYEGAIAFYTKAHSTRGCFLVSAALAEAPQNERAEAIAARTFASFDKLFAKRFRAARARGELPAHANDQALSRLATATLHSLAVRARSGAPRTELRKLATATVDTLCGPPTGKRTKPG